MRFVIAGVILLFSFIVGVCSVMTVPMFENVDNDTLEEGFRHHSVMTFSAFFSKENWKQILFVCSMSLVCTLAADLSYVSGTGILSLFRQVVVSWILFSAMIIDGKTRIIPNVLVIGAIGSGILILCLEFIFERELFSTSLIMSVVGLVCCVVLFYVLSRLTRDGMGMGDVKLISAMGFLLGFSSTLFAVLLSLIICTVVSLVLLFARKKNKDDSVPFGPFMFFGYILMFLLISL